MDEVPFAIAVQKGEKHLKIKEMVKEAVESGVPPIIFEYSPIVFFHENRKVARTFMVINSLDLGTLKLQQYRYVARRTKQGNHMVKRHIDKLVRMISGGEEDPSIECYTIPVYARLLKEGELAGMLFEALTLYPEVPASKLCVELSADILFEDMEESRKRIDELRGLGVRVAISEVGDEFCPVFRLAELRFDYAFLDAYATASLSREDADRVAGSLVSYLHFLDVAVIAPDLVSDEQIAGAESVECNGYTLGERLPVEDPPEEWVGELTVEEEDAAPAISLAESFENEALPGEEVSDQ